MKEWYIVSSPSLGEVFCDNEKEARHLFLEECKIHGGKAISTYVIPKYEYDKAIEALKESKHPECIDPHTVFHCQCKRCKVLRQQVSTACTQEKK